MTENHDAAERSAAADRAIIAAATPGEWEAIGPIIVGVIAPCDCPPDPEVWEGEFPLHEQHDIVAPTADCDRLDDELRPWERYVADCRFIAAARQGWPYWIAAAEAERADNARLRESLVSAAQGLRAALAMHQWSLNEGPLREALRGILAKLEAHP